MMSTMSAPSTVSAPPSERLKPYVPRLLVDWLRDSPEHTYQEVDGTLAFVDISGFTRLTERLARQGKGGAEEMSDLLNVTFASLLDVAYANGAGLVKWGGDAVLLLFDGAGHAERACRAAHDMRTTMRQVGRLKTSVGQITLRMSVGIHSDTFHFFLVGDPEYHRELIVSGPAASTTAMVEALADAGEIGLSQRTASLLNPSCVGRPKGDAFLLRSRPDVAEVGVPPAKDVLDLDLAAVLPVGIREHLLANPGEAEHRTIAVAFVQFSGTDDLLERQGPQALADALGEAMANIQQATASQGVTFFETDINRDGGKVMLTAGAPVSRGHDEDRMLRAARLIIERAGRLPLRIGVNRGSVFSGDFGPLFRKTYSVKGDAINLAARVMGKAAPGEVLATRAVLDRARTSFETSDIPPFLVKGKSKPVNAVQVGPVRAAAQERPELLDLPPMRGRDREAKVLATALDRLRAGTGSRLRISGEPGIGKTRLVQHLEASAAGVRLLSTSCDEFEESTPYLPVRRLVRASLGVPAEASGAEVEEALRERVNQTAPELGPWLPLLGIVTGVEFPPTSETASLGEAFRKNRMEEVCTQFLVRLLDEPCLLVVEDLHFADEASRDLVGRIGSAAAEGQPWLLVVSDRDARTGGIPEGAPAEQVLVLRRLTVEDSTNLVLDETQERPLPPAVVTALVERSGGNPLFLRGLLLVQATGGDELGQLPETIEGLVTAEIDRLPPDLRRTLRYAAVLGTTVDESLLRYLLGDEHIARRPLRAFIRSAGPGRLRFRHALIRDVAYDGLPYRRRRELHDIVGNRLLELMADAAATPEPLALHFFHAGRAQEAWTYCRLAGERARAQYAQSEAARFLAWAAESGRRAGASPTEVGEVLEALGDVRYLLGLSAEATKTYRQALHVVRGDPVRQAALLLKEGRIQQRLGNLSQSLRRLTGGIHLVEGLDDPTALAVHSRLASRYAIARYQEGKYSAARSWGERALGLAERSGDLLAAAEAHNALEAVGLWSGHSSDVPHGERALGLYKQMGDISGQAHCLNNLAVRAVLEGRWDEGQSLLHQAAETFERAGDEAGLAVAVYNQADVLVRQGRVEQAEPLLQRALRVARSVGDEDTVALAIRESGKAAARAGRYEESRTLLAEGAVRLEALGEPQEVADATTAVAESYLLEGQWQKALDVTDGVLARGEAEVTLLPTVHRVRGFAFLAAGAVDAARQSFETGLELGSSPVTRHEQAMLQEGMAEVAARTGDPSAPELAATARATLDALGVVAAPLPRGAPT